MTSFTRFRPTASSSPRRVSIAPRETVKCCIALGVGLLAAQSASAQFIWNSAGGGAWTAQNVWAGTSGSNKVPDASGETATLGDFAGTSAIAITVTGQVSPSSVSFTNTATTAYSLSGTGNFTNSAISKSSGAGSVTFGVAIQGTSSVTATVGTLTLTSASNTYNGGTTVNGGSLVISGSGKLGSTSGALTVSGGTLDLGATSQTTGTVSLTSGTISNGTLTGSSYALQAGTITAALSGSGVLTKTGSGTLTLSGTNTFSGGTNLNAGIVTAGSSQALGTSGTITFGGGTLQYGSGISTDYSGRIANSSGAIAIDTNGQNVTFASALGGTNTGGLTKSGTGNLTLNGANTYTGGTTVNAGNLIVGSTGSLSSTGAVTVNTGGTLTINNTNATIGTLSGTSGTINFGSTGTLTINQATNGSFAGTLASTGASLAKSGGGTLTLSGGNNYSGGTSVTGGTLAFSGSNTNIGSLSIGSGGRVEIGASNTLPSNTSVTLNGGTLAFGGAFSQGLGPLAVAATSTIDFKSGTGASALAFGDSSGTSWTGTSLSILNYNTGSDSIRFGSSNNALTSDQLAKISINGFVAQWSAGGGGFIEPSLTAIPEPSTYAAMFGAAALGFAYYRRRKQAAKVETKVVASA